MTRRSSKNVASGSRGGKTQFQAADSRQTSAPPIAELNGADRRETRAGGMHWVGEENADSEMANNIVVSEADTSCEWV
jgi:hypothetical protein